MRSRESCNREWQPSPEPTCPVYIFNQKCDTDKPESPDRDVLENNFGKILDIVDLMDDGELKYAGTETVWREDEVIRVFDEYKSESCIDTRTGEIIAFDNQDEVDPEIRYGEDTLPVELRILRDREEYRRPDDDYYQAWQVRIELPDEASQNGSPQLTDFLSERAVDNLEATLRWCNEP